MRLTGHAAPFVSRWLAVIGAFDPQCSSKKLFPQGSAAVPPVVFLDRGHPRFGNFNNNYFIIPVDVIRVKSCVNSFLDPTGVSVRVSINKLYLVTKRIMVSLVGVLRNSGGLGTGESYIPVVLFDSLLHGSPCFPDVDFAVLTGNPVNHAILFSQIDGVLKSHQVWPECRVRFEDSANVLLF